MVEDHDPTKKDIHTSKLCSKNIFRLYNDSVGCKDDLDIIYKKIYKLKYKNLFIKITIKNHQRNQGVSNPNYK